MPKQAAAAGAPLTVHAVAVRVAELTADCVLPVSADHQLKAALKRKPRVTAWAIAFMRREVADERPPADVLADVRKVAAANPATAAEIKSLAVGKNLYVVLSNIREWANSVLRTTPSAVADLPAWLDAMVPQFVWADTNLPGGVLLGDDPSRDNAVAGRQIIEECRRRGVRPDGIERPGATMSYFDLMQLADRLRIAVEKHIAGPVAVAGESETAESQAAMSAASPRPMLDETDLLVLSVLARVRCRMSVHAIAREYESGINRRDRDTITISTHRLVDWKLIDQHFTANGRRHGVGINAHGLDALAERRPAKTPPTSGQSAATSADPARLNGRHEQPQPSGRGRPPNRAGRPGA